MSTHSNVVRLILAAIGALILAQSVAGAAEAPVIKPGVRVRVKATEVIDGSVRKKIVSGALLEIGQEFITVENALTRVVEIFPRESISKLEVRISERRHGEGALKGLGLGAAAGAVLGFVTTSKDGWFSPGEAALVLAGLFGVAGALVGVIWAPGEQWESVPFGSASISLDYNKSNGSRVFVSVFF